MFTTVQMVIIVIAVVVAGALAGVVFYLLVRKNMRSSFPMFDFSENYVAPKMSNTDISIDDVVKNFKLID